MKRPLIVIEPGRIKTVDELRREYAAVLIEALAVQTRKGLKADFDLIERCNRILRQLAQGES